MIEYAFLIPIIPLIVSAVILLFGKEKGDKSWMPYLGIAAMAWCFFHASWLLALALNNPAPFINPVDPPYYQTLNWFQFGDFTQIMTVGALIDGPCVVLLFVVTLVSLLVQIYSLGYMHGDARFKRYYAFLSFFTASMLGLVVSSNLLVLFACWELVGLASYLLIGFWFEKPGPAYASKKAFITTKLGDCGLYVGLLLLFSVAETFDLNSLAHQVARGDHPVELLTAVGLCFLFGAVGKSAQLPLFIWLPDAMEGPTPVSALIHAATMVVAGIYLIARTYFIFAAAPIAMGAVAWVGLFTALFAATMAVTAFDIKRVLAYSTISQLGYMMLALGVGGYSAGLFHLSTHAFFKALLFLGAGSVIHAVHTNDMREMGGLRTRMMLTCITMGIATLAISGFPGLAGWYSKEAILHAAYEHNPGMWFIGLVTAGLTTFYMFRLMFLTFGGKSRDHHKWDHAHESPWTMTLPMGILAALSVVSGIGLEHHHLFADLVKFDLGHEAAHHAPHWLGGAAIAVFAIGFGLAYKLYGGSLKTAEGLRGRFCWAVNLLENRYYFDEFFLWWVDFFDKVAKICHWVDDNIIDAIFIDGWALLVRALAAISGFFDDFFVDGAVDGVGTIAQDFGWGLRRFVNGRVQEYLLYVSMAVMAFAIFIATR